MCTTSARKRGGEERDVETIGETEGSLQPGVLKGRKRGKSRTSGRRLAHAESKIERRGGAQEGGSAASSLGFRLKKMTDLGSGLGKRAKEKDRKGGEQSS